jgi:hypothetical protein
MWLHGFMASIHIVHAHCETEYVRRGVSPVRVVGKGKTPVNLAQIPGTVPLDILAIVIVGYIAMRQFREKRMQVSRLWVLPALTLLFSYAGIQGDLFDTAFSPAIIGAAFLIGLVVGGIRGAATKLTIDAIKQTITVKGTFISVALWLALLGVKGVADFVLSASGKTDTVAGVATTLVTAALLAFSLGAVIATRVYYYWRYALAIA